ncbi:MAG: hypothetical protein KGJ45_11460 [Elusimicrobia bacterium]|nr:hypothetical protein [Elusimicrobiota bacterium]
MIAQPAWYRWAERQLDAVVWLPYAAALVVILVTALLLILSFSGHDTKVLLTAWLVYLFMP